MKIETACLKDMPEILALQKIAYLSEAEIYQDFMIPPLIQTLEEIEEDFKKQIFLKAIEQGMIVGSVRGYLENGTCHIGRLIVRPERQNKGMGTSLMKAMERQFQDAVRYELFTGEKSMRNLSLYQKLGYRVYNNRRLSDRVRLLYLEKWNLRKPEDVDDS